jgi:hypothetical protein
MVQGKYSPCEFLAFLIDVGARILRELAPIIQDKSRRESEGEARRDRVRGLVGE